MADQDRSARGAGSGNEARDTIDGCRNRAAEDRIQAAGSDTENGRKVFERSAASWEARAHQIEEVEKASAQQRSADRDLWDSEEGDPVIPDD